MRFSNISQAHTCPLILITIKRIDFLLSFYISSKVFQEEVLIVVGDEGFVNFSTFSLSIWNRTVNKGINDTTNDWVIFINCTRVVIVTCIVFINFVLVHTEDDNILIANFVLDFNVGTVKCRQGNSTSHHEFHVWCTRCFFRSQWNLLRDICCWNDKFC